MDESLAGLRMLALYRSGRQADALSAFAQLRRQLVDEIGDEPGAQIQALHDQILRRDPMLELPDRSTVSLQHELAATSPIAVAPEPTIPPAQLPPDVAGFVGRNRELAALDEFVPSEHSQSAAVVLAVIDGAAGAGKTTLAVHWAQRARNRFPDGQLYADLRGYAADSPLDPLHVLSQFLRALGAPAETIPVDVAEAAAMYRSLLADRRVLVLLDNAATAGQVRPLIPSGAGSMVLVTSRHQLTGLVARDGAHRMSLGVLAPAEAESLLVSLIGTERAGTEREQLKVLAQLCAHLPLALRVAAANLVARPSRRIVDYLAEVQRGDPLAALAVTDDADSGLLAALDLSYMRLPDPVRRMFRLLGLSPCGEIGVAAAARLAGTDSVGAARALEALANAHLIEERTSGRFGCHELLRQYAATRASDEEPPAECAAAQERLYDYYLELTDAAADVAFPQGMRARRQAGSPDRIAEVRFEDADDARVWLDLERMNLVAIVHHATDTGRHQQAWQLADNLRGYFWIHMHTAEWIACARAGLAAARSSHDLCGQAAGHLSLASAYWRTGRFREAAYHGTRALLLAQRADWAPGEAAVLGNLALVHARLGDIELGVSQLRRALMLSRETGWRHGEASALGNLGMMLTQAGRLAQGEEVATEALAMNEELGSRNSRAINLLTLGIVDYVRGQHEQAEDRLERAHALFTEVQSSSGLCCTRYWLALLHGACGRFEQAGEMAESTMALARTKGHTEFVIHGLNAWADARLGRADHARAVDAYLEAIKVAQQLDDHCPAVAEAHIGLARAYLPVGGLDRARGHIERGLRVAANAGSGLLEAQALTVLGHVHLAHGDVDAAIDVGSRALALHDAIGHRLGQQRTQQLLAQALLHRDDTDRSIRHRELSHRL